MNAHRSPLPVVRATAAVIIATACLGQGLAQETPEGDAVTAMPLALTSAVGTQQIVVRLRSAPLARVAGNKRTGLTMTGDQQRAYLAQVAQEQAAVETQIQSFGGTTLARISKAHNALVVSIDANQIAAIAQLPAVATVRPVVHYEKFLGSTVPYVGAAAAHALGYDGAGMRIAVLDSGIDYTHRNFGGPGTLAGYTAAYGSAPGDSQNKTRDGLFPTAKVYEGFDFVGEEWPNGPRAADPDPIDFEGHGTHVADIAAGRSSDGTHIGVAPGAQLLAVKVCSAVATSCNGIALLLGMDFSLDPNGDGDIADAVDVINMSLGSNYGQREDDLSEASTIASQFGVVVVAASGNAGDRPYITSSPASTPAVISVGQSHVPTARQFPLVIHSPPAIAGTYANTATVEWAPIGAGFANTPVAFVGRGCPAGSVAGQPGEDPYLASPAGKIALIDRGACGFSLKVDRAANAGAVGVLIANNAAGDAPSFSFGGGSIFVPTLIVTQTIGNTIKTQLGSSIVNVSVVPANSLPLVGSMVSTSSRGPGYSYSSIKPDISAPGASVSAEAGTGTGETAFGGTSGATPMVSGAAALVLQRYPSLQPHQVKARLMAAAETNVQTNPALLPGALAPITRVGAGELRVDRSLALATGAWDAADPASVSLSVGSYRFSGSQVFRKKIVVSNYSGAARTYNLSSSFRYANDAASGALNVSMPATINVPALGNAVFTMTVTANANLLPNWVLNGGTQGGNGAALNDPEYDGFLTIQDATDTVRLPWHILPHKAANLTPSTTSAALGGNPTGLLGLTNPGGATTGQVEVFLLTGTSPKLPATTLPRPGDNFAIVDLKAVGVRGVVSGGLPIVQFAATTWGERAHPNYPAEFDVLIDSNIDGVDDFAIFNTELGGFGVTGQNVTTIVNLATRATSTFFFTVADLDSADAILTAPMANVGLTPGTRFSYRVGAFDNYFTGAATDVIGPMVVRLDTPRFAFAPSSFPVAANGAANVTITRNAAGDAASPAQSGLLLMYVHGRKGREADAIQVSP
jgi:minor extracellular serine protease Vpr